MDYRKYSNPSPGKMGILANEFILLVTPFGAGNNSCCKSWLALLDIPTGQRLVHIFSPDIPLL